MYISVIHKFSEHRIVTPQSEKKPNINQWGTFLTEGTPGHRLSTPQPYIPFPFAFRFFVPVGKGINIIPALVLSPC